MKIDQDLRAAINAAAKAQPDMGWRERIDIVAKAVEAFLKKKPAMVKKVNALILKLNDLKRQQQALTAQINKVLGPLGLCVGSEGIKASFTDWMDQPDADAFMDAGGILPPPHRSKWKAEKLIAELASADPKKRDAILKQYGIDWS